MSNFRKMTVHPKTGELLLADWLDNFFGLHRYGIRFPGSDAVFTESQIKHEGSPVTKNPLNPPVALLCQLTSIVVHAQEAKEPGGHELDTIALDALLQDANVNEWVAAMTKIAMAPVKRTAPAKTEHKKPLSKSLGMPVVTKPAFANINGQVFEITQN